MYEIGATISCNYCIDAPDFESLEQSRSDSQVPGCYCKVNQNTSNITE